MSMWEKSYQMFSEVLPSDCRNYSTYLKRKNQFAIPDNCFVHFDIPLTLEHERQLLQNAGFALEKVLDNLDSATIIAARKGD